MLARASCEPDNVTKQDGLAMALVAAKRPYLSCSDDLTLQLVWEMEKAMKAGFE